MYTDTEIKKILSRKLKKERFNHTLGACETAIKMAKAFGADEEKVYIAALLHDCAKYMSFEEQIEYAKKLDMQISEEEFLCPAVIHAPLGAAIAKVEYGIDDEEILDAIKAHTVAKENMSEIDKIIYSADLIEPSRSFDGVEELREYSETDLDLTFMKCLRTSIMFNLSKDNAVHPDSLKCWNNIVRKGK